MIFTCEQITNEEKEEWQGEISKINKHNDCYEIFITSRSSIMVIFGSTSRGGFVCIPDFNVGCHLVDLKDRFWNREKLTEVLGYVDGITVASALYVISDELTIRLLPDLEDRAL